MKRLLSLLAIVLICATILSAQAVAPFPGMRLQGSLTDNTGQLLNGQFDLTIRIYKVASGGLPIYSEYFPTVQVANGIFDLLINASGLGFDSLYWTEVQLNNEIFSPRTQLASVPFAYRSMKADTSVYSLAAPPVGPAGGALTGTYPNPQIPDTSIAATKLATGSVTSQKILNGTIQFVDIGQNGATTGQVMKWNGSSWIAGDDNAGSGVFLPLTGGQMRGAITSDTSAPSITMGKGNFGRDNINSGTYSFVAGRNNRARGDYSVVAGGGGETLADSNLAKGLQSTVGGGTGNRAIGDFNTVAGGHLNSAVVFNSTVGGGEGNTAYGEEVTIAGGTNNIAAGTSSFIGGGHGNVADGGVVCGGSTNYARYSAGIVGGYENNATGNSSFIGGGSKNFVSGEYSFVGGGSWNRNRGNYSVIVGGGGADPIDSNFISDNYAFSSIIGGGSRNRIDGYTYCVIGGGYNNSMNSSGAVIAGGRNNSTWLGTGCTIGGGEGNVCYDWGTIAGGKDNSAGGQEGWQSYGTIGGGHNNITEWMESTVGGGASNLAGSSGSVVSGGRHNQAGTAMAHYYVNSSDATVSGGANNYALTEFSTIGGGRNNSAGTVVYVEGSGVGSFAPTVSGGELNQSLSDYGSIIGGKSNIVNGRFSSVLGGFSNTADGGYALAAGQQAKAIHNGSFVWADSSNADFSSTSANQFNVRATGGTRIFSNAGLTAGVTLAPGASSWASVSDSTKKRNARLVDTKQILKKLASLPIKQWSYRAQDPSIEHIGPMAQDFYNTFGLGDDNVTISTIDPSGVALAAIQALYEENQDLKSRLARLEAMMEKLSGESATGSDLGSIR